MTDATRYDRDLSLGGNISVTGGGQLTLENMTLTMDVPSDGALKIYVEAGSSIELVNVRVLSSDPDAHYWFEARGRAVIRGSDLRDLASSSHRWDYLDAIYGGVQIYDGSSLLLNSSFHDSQRICAFVDGCSPRIEGCSFYNAEYYSSYTLYGYSNTYYNYVNVHYTDATGLFLVDADPYITECEFRANGLASTVLPLYNTSYSHNGVSTFGRGVLAFHSSPNVTRCTFSWNGRQPDDRTVEGVRQAFFDYFFNYDAHEGGLVCIGSGARPTVIGSKITDNDVFGVLGLDGGYPRLMEHCLVEENQYIRYDAVQRPSAGVQVHGTPGTNGTITVANSTFRGNMVFANIWVEEVSLVLVNYTNLDNWIDNVYNIHVTRGRHRIVNSTLVGSNEMRYNLYIGSGRASIQVYIEGSKIIGGSYGIYDQNYRETYIWMANSTVTDAYVTAYLMNTNIDCLDSRFSPEVFEIYLYSAECIVRFLHYLTVDVQWQNGVVIGNASVMIANGTREEVNSWPTGSDGSTGPLLLVERSLHLYESRQWEEWNTPFFISAYSSGLSSSETVVAFESGQGVLLVIYDHIDPTIHVLNPPTGHTQNITTVRVRGLSSDVGSGVQRTELSADNATWRTIGTFLWNATIELPEGVHTLYLRVLDVAGNEALARIDGIRIDLTPPPIELEDFTGTYYTNRTEFVIRGETEVRSTVYLNHVPVIVDLPDSTFSLTIVLEEDGGVNLTISVADYVGNVNETRVRVVRDTVPPLIYLERPLELTNRSTVEIRGRVVDMNLAGIWLMGRPFPNDTINVSMMFVDGPVRIVVEAWDKAGNLARAVWELRVDTAAPRLRIEWPTEGLITNSSRLEVRVTALEELAGLWVDGAPAEAVEDGYSRSVNLSQGRNTIEVTATDLAGNTARAWVNVTLDTTPPVLSVTAPADRTYTNHPSILVEGTVEGAVSVRVNGVSCLAGGVFAQRVDLEVTEGGQTPNLIEVVARDEADNEDRVLIRVFRDDRPPKLVVAPLKARTRLAMVYLNGTITDDHGASHVMVNGKRYLVDETGRFSVLAQLDPGINVMKVVAVDVAGNEATETLTVELLEPEEEEPPSGPSGALLGLLLLMGLVTAVVLGWYVLRHGRKD